MRSGIEASARWEAAYRRRASPRARGRRAARTRSAPSPSTSKLTTTLKSSAESARFSSSVSSPLPLAPPDVHSSPRVEIAPHSNFHPSRLAHLPDTPADSAHPHRIGRIREINDSEANEDYPPKRLLQRRITALPSHHLQESVHRTVTSIICGVQVLIQRPQTSWIQLKRSFSHSESSKWIQQKASTGSVWRIDQLQRHRH